MGINLMRSWFSTVICLGQLPRGWARRLEAAVTWRFPVWLNAS